MKANAVMPVTLVTGFLGAGKTTFLNEILRRNASSNFLIIENEAGNINIDRELLKGKAKKNVFELNGGCICCSLSTELGTVLNSVIMSQVKYDYVLIEATGMADVGAIINMMSGARVQRYFKLDAVVGLVDASTFLARLAQFAEVRKQVAQSTLLILNKCDLLVSDKLQEIEKQLITINPLARIAKTSYADLANIQVLNCESFTPEAIEEKTTRFSALTWVNASTEHAHPLQTLNYNITGNFDMKKVSVWFEEFLHANAKNIVRIKAILSIADMQHKMVLQSVGDDYHLSQGARWLDDQTRENKIVLIGTNMHEAEIEKSLCAQLVETKLN